MITRRVSAVDHGTVLVTGASSGIGRALAVRVAPRAATLILIARRADLLDQLRTELAARHPRLRVLTVPVDLTDENDVERALRRIHDTVGLVDVLINNAGVGDQALFDRTDWARTRQVLHTNVLAVAQLTSALVPGMVARGRGGVLIIGSGAGLTVMPAAAAYTGSKHFVNGFTEALRADLAGTGVVVTQVCPGPVDSQFDATAGTVGGMTGGPPQFLRLSADECARQALDGFDQAEPLVFPGWAYRVAMHLLPLIPRSFLRRQAGRSAQAIRRSQSS
jgi:short-subunit dehydrogenase